MNAAAVAAAAAGQQALCVLHDGAARVSFGNVLLTLDRLRMVDALRLSLCVLGRGKAVPKGMAVSCITGVAFTVLGAPHGHAFFIPFWFLSRVY
jgi:hypothetical protein